MNDFIKLNQLLEKGYLLIDRVPLPLSELTAKSFANFTSVFSIKTDPRVLLDNSNKGKHLLLLRHLPTGKSVEMITSDDKTISRANEQIGFQREPIGNLVRARCVALGGSSVSSRVFHLDNLVKSLDSLCGWEFKLADSVNAMEAVIRIDSTEQGAIEESIEKLQSLLDGLSATLNVGFHIQHCNIAPITRMGPTASFGPEERMLPAITPEKIFKIEEMFSSSNAKKAARGLNQAFIENCMPSRISMLWSALEDIFTENAEPLLSKEEIEKLIECVENVESMKKNHDRIISLKEALSNPQRLPRISRNKMIAKGVASVLNINEDEAYSKVREASRQRGKHGHKLKIDWKDIEESEKFLQEVLLCYLKLLELAF